MWDQTQAPVGMGATGLGSQHRDNTGTTLTVLSSASAVENSRLPGQWAGAQIC